MSATSNNVKICFQEVRQRFRVIHDRPATFRQAFARLFRQSSEVREFDALDRISFEVLSGETVGIIGRNGSGKSTVLKIIARIYQPTAGRVEVFGRVSPLIELGAGFHPELTGRENIILAGALMGIDPDDMRSRMDAVISFCELQDFIDAPVKQYSSGMYARLGFAIATEIDPDILLVDEILAVGDGAFQQKCLERMDNFRRQGKTIVYVSHDMNSVKELCSRALLLDHGHLLETGEPEEVVVRYHQLLQTSAAV